MLEIAERVKAKGARTIASSIVSSRCSARRCQHRPFKARLRLGRFIGMVSGEENTYFLRAFEALGVTEGRRATDPDTQPTAGFQSIMRELQKRAATPPHTISTDLSTASMPMSRNIQARCFALA